MSHLLCHNDSLLSFLRFNVVRPWWDWELGGQPAWSRMAFWRKCRERGENLMISWSLPFTWPSNSSTTSIICNSLLVPINWCKKGTSTCSMNNWSPFGRLRITVTDVAIWLLSWLFMKTAHGISPSMMQHLKTLVTRHKASAWYVQYMKRWGNTNYPIDQYAIFCLIVVQVHLIPFLWNTWRHIHGSESPCSIYKGVVKVAAGNIGNLRLSWSNGNQMLMSLPSPKLKVRGLEWW